MTVDLCGPPSVPSDKSPRLQVIGAGLPRTGTLSLSLALERLLAGPSMHGGTQVLGREDAYVKLLHDIFINRNSRPVLLKLLREATAGFVALTDVLGPSFLPELLELYPDAKVVLVTRDPERWLTSAARVYQRIPSWFRLLIWPCPGRRWLPSLMDEMVKKDAERLPCLRPGDPVTTNFATEHINWVKRITPPDRLLIMSLDQGWEPLCRFLDKPIPDGPFPHTNESRTLEAVGRRIIRTAVAVWAGILLVSVMALSLASRICMR